MAGSDRISCPACGKPTASVGRVCVHCNHPLDGVLASTARDPVACPRCAANCEFATIGTARIDLCAACGGAWLDRGELEDLEVDLTDRATALQAWSVIDRVKARPAPSDRRFLRCPLCNTAMSHKDWHQAADVVLDVCPRHGAWLDRSDLLAVLEILASGKITELEAREAKRRENEASWRNEAERCQQESDAAALNARRRQRLWNYLTGGRPPGGKRFF